MSYRSVIPFSRQELCSEHRTVCDHGDADDPAWNGTFLEATEATKKAPIQQRAMAVTTTADRTICVHE